MRHPSLIQATSWAAMLWIGAFYVWITVAPSGYSAAPVAAVIMAGIVLALLKLGVRKPVAYWEAVSTPNQAGLVCLIILTSVVLRFVIGAFLSRSAEWEWLMFSPLDLLITIAVPLAFIAFGGVRWPRRVARPRLVGLLVVAGFSIAFAVLMVSFQVPKQDVPASPPSIVEVLGSLGETALAATTEELTYRVLLLTALVKVSGSRIQALVISSAIFALVHIPPSLAIPLYLQDAEMLRFYATGFFPELVWIIAIGFFFGALWLRTGSIVLISLVHTILNLAPVIVGGAKAF
jgi:membrane protease YdiL (CAAX protease family)